MTVVIKPDITEANQHEVLGNILQKLLKKAVLSGDFFLTQSSTMSCVKDLKAFFGSKRNLII